MDDGILITANMREISIYFQKALPIFIALQTHLIIWSISDQVVRKPITLSDRNYTFRV